MNDDLVPMRPNRMDARLSNDEFSSFLSTWVLHPPNLRWTPFLRPRDAIFKLVFREAAQCFVASDCSRLKSI